MAYIIYLMGDEERIFFSIGEPNFQSMSRGSTIQSFTIGAFMVRETP